EEISMLIDVSQTYQSYIEDCETCCNPIQVSVTTENQQIISFQSENIEQ
ncbi:CPXCG motif-containing cysteine-rich protein, partial [Winogradskyella sp.]|nr:CPXCG motif-containing cysteine-rich protein [Winogradskyella sp.]